MTEERVRLTDIFTNAAAIADYSSAESVEPAHLLEAIEHLRQGRPWQLSDDTPVRSPLGRSRSRASVPDAVRELAQVWFVRKQSDPLAELDSGELDELTRQIRDMGGSLPE